jgi:hypothetical protein
MIIPPIIIERVTLVAPLGLRFWDRVSGTAIGDGLAVTAYPPDNPARRTQALATRSSVYVLRNLPGLHDVESGAGDASFWQRPPARRLFVVEVVDELGRFLPFLFHTELPVRGLFTWTCAQGPALIATPGQVPLYSSTGRLAPAGMAVIRADLWDPDLADGKGGPAAWAVLEAAFAGPAPLRVRGLADVRGRVALIFPYPEPLGAPLSPVAGSPLGATGPALVDQVWDVRLRATYQPSDKPPDIPDLCDTLTQPAADLWGDLGRQRPLAQQTLEYGQELVVRSEDDSGLTRPAVLVVTAAGSPF